MTDSQARPAFLRDAPLAFQRIREYAIFLLEPDGTVASWNEGAQVIKGYSDAEIIGQSFSRFYTPEDLLAGKPAEILSRASRDGRVEEEAWRLRKDGSRFWADVVVTALRDPDGTLRGFVKITRDLTARKLAEKALRQSEERMRLMIDSVRDYAIFMLDPTGRVASWNPGAERLKGYTAREIIGHSFERFYPEQELRAGKPRLELEIAAREGRFEEEGWRLRKDGSRFWANVVLSAVRDERGVLVGYAKVTRDLTERKRSEEAVIERARQQAAVAQLGLFALEHPDLDAVIDRAVTTVRETMGTELVGVLELSEDGKSLVLRAGCGLDVAAMGRVPIELDGVAEAGYTLSSAGPANLEERRFRTLIVPSGPGVVRTKEAESRQFERDGSVEDGGYSVGVNDVWSEAQLSRAKDGRYTIKGKHDGKPFENALPAPDGIATENLVQRASRAILAKKIESRKFQTFEVEKHDSLLTFTLRRDPSRPSALVMEGAAAPPITLEMDPSGRSKSSSVNMGAHRLTTETLFVSGSLP